MSGEEEGFLARWSRRKRAEPARRAAEDAPAAPPAAPLPSAALPSLAQPPADAPPVAALPPQAAPPGQPVAAPPEDPPFDPASLPPVDTLTEASDFAAFLRKGVPEALRRQALRRAWTLDPGIRDFVGLADYDWDFNAEGGVPGFSLALGGDAKKMLAELYRAATEPPPAPADEPALPPGNEDAPEAAPPPPLAPVASVAAPVTLAAIPPGPEAAGPVAEDPAPAPRRRHGSALPS